MEGEKKKVDVEEKGLPVAAALSGQIAVIFTVLGIGLLIAMLGFALEFIAKGVSQLVLVVAFLSIGVQSAVNR